MEVFSIEADTELFNVRPKQEKDLDDLLATTRGQLHWPCDRDVKLEISGSPAVEKIIYTDFPYFGSLFPLCLSPYANEIISEKLLGSGYYVDTDLNNPRDRENKFYKLFFFTKVLEALDIDSSVYANYLDGRIMSVYCHALIEERLEDQCIFKVNHAGRNSTFVTGDFKKFLEESNLTGFLFSPIWSSETGPFDTRLFSPYAPAGGDRKRANRVVAAKRERARKILAARPTM